MNRKFFFLIYVFLIFFFSGIAQNNKLSDIYSTKVWPVEKAKTWYKMHPWIAGSNFIPSSAINQLEMWQKETFDTTTINRELGWAQNIGFNAMRVFLHSVVWKEDPAGFKKRIDQYLTIANRHHIQTIFVFFDDCWNKIPVAGKQPEPKVGVHNSGWMQDPGDPMYKDTTLFPVLEKYVTDIMTSFSKDKRILLWDLYNEPGNEGKKMLSIPLLKNVFKWAHKVNPDQPVTSGLWAWDLEEINLIQVENSDIITYHDYEEPESHQRVIQFLKLIGRPLICTEYMARTRNSRFSNILPLLKKENVGAINWGLVSGKTNTIFAWDTPMPNGDQPKEWFHDIFHKDGTPYKQDEIDLIKKLTGESE